MPTLSFDFIFASGTKDFVPPERGYSISLHGQAGDLTRFEADSVAVCTAAVILKLSRSATPTELQIEMRGEPHELADLRSRHYTWRIQRSDGKPMGMAEVQYALMMQAMRREREPVYVIPRSALKRLLVADKALGLALFDAVADADHMQREVLIPDPDVAAQLVNIGLITPSAEPSKYALMDIEVH